MSGFQAKYNLKSPAVKRLMREAVELKDPTYHYHAQPLEDNLFEWHFTVRGPPDTAFHDGRYHGRITLPAEYPMKPPSIILLTPNGRFELGKKICLSMSAHHPETWQPSWSLRTVLVALIGFMPSKGAGAIGALDYTPDERKRLAVKSKDWSCDVCGFDHRVCLLETDIDSREVIDKDDAVHIVFKGEAEKSDVVPPVTPVSESNETSHDVNPQHATIETDQSSLNKVTSDSPSLNGVVPDTPSLNEAIPDTPSLNEPDTVLRHRGEQASNVNEVNETSERNTAAATSQQTSTNHAADYISLILLWIVAAVLVLLILRRLALEGNTLKSNV